MNSLLARLCNARVLSVGDVMLDRYWWGSVHRISPEAPVPVVKIERMTLAAGGAANVAANVASLQAEACLVGVVGSDPEARQCTDAVEAAGVRRHRLIEVSHRPTTVKTRLVAHNQ